MCRSPTPDVAREIGVLIIRRILGSSFPSLATHAQSRSFPRTTSATWQGVTNAPYISCRRWHSEPLTVSRPPWCNLIPTGRTTKATWLNDGPNEHAKFYTSPGSSKQLRNGRPYTRRVHIPSNIAIRTTLPPDCTLMQCFNFAFIVSL